jgi:hypothetical protein
MSPPFRFREPPDPGAARSRAPPTRSSHNLPLRAGSRVQESVSHPEDFSGFWRLGLPDRPDFRPHLHGLAIAAI